MSDLFFPQRVLLHLDGKRYSPAVTERIVAVGGSSTSFAVGSKMLALLMDLKVSAKTVSTTTVTIGSELGQQRDELADAYRQAGLPITSCLIESQVKEMNKRVKGSEKFWNDGEEGEAILQVNAALISDDDRLSSHMRSRPGSPYVRPTRKIGASREFVGRWP